MSGHESDRWTVGEIADAAGVTVRTLHHYDEIGLLVPSARSKAGYRLYARADLERLQQILLHRELGFSLEAIQGLLERPLVDRVSALEAQRQLLLEKLDRTAAVLRALDRIIESLTGGTSMTTDEIFEGFSAFSDAPDDVKDHQAEHGAEAHRRWGETDPWKESIRRASDFDEEDWKRIQAEGEALEARMAELLESGADSRGREARAVAEEMRLHIGNFYECSHAMHAELADMYESDPRFRAHYDDRAEGLAAFVATAVRANATGR